MKEGTQVKRDLRDILTEEANGPYLDPDFNKLLKKIRQMGNLNTNWIFNIKV